MAIEGAIFKQGAIWNPVVRRGIMGAVAGGAIGAAYGSISDSPNATGTGAMLGGILGGLSGVGKLSRMQGAAELIGEKGNRMSTLTNLAKEKGAGAARWFEKSGLGAKTDDVGNFTEGLAKQFFGKQEWFNNNAWAPRAAFGVGKGAVIGAGVGAAYGLVSDNDSMFGGMVKGAMLGGVMGGIRYGASEKAYNLRQGIKSSGGAAENTIAKEASVVKEGYSGRVVNNVHGNKITDPSRLLSEHSVITNNPVGVSRSGDTIPSMLTPQQFRSTTTGEHLGGAIPQEIKGGFVGETRGRSKMPFPGAPPPIDKVEIVANTPINKTPSIFKPRMQKIWGGIKSTLGTVGSKISEKTSSLANRVSKGFSSSGSKVTSRTSRNIGAGIKSFGKKIGRAAGSVWRGTLDISKRAISSVGRGISGAYGYASRGVKAVGRIVSNTASRVGNSINGFGMGMRARIAGIGDMNKARWAGARADREQAIAVDAFAQSTKSTDSMQSMFNSGASRKKIISYARTQGYGGTNDQIWGNLNKKFGGKAQWQ